MTSTAAYLQFADNLQHQGILTDPWVNGDPRFSTSPVLLTEQELREVHATAERVASVYNEMCALVFAAPTHLDDFFLLSPCQKLMWFASAPMWHGMARADVFRTRTGHLKVCELNSDTPTGHPEAYVLGKLQLDQFPNALDPNHELETRFCALVNAMSGQTNQANRTIGIVYPTDLPEDLSLIRLFRSFLEPRGFHVAIGSPYNIERSRSGKPMLLGSECDVILRHYKTDWWGERAPVWKDAEPFLDPFPLHKPLEILVRSILERTATVINPFGSVLTQNKRAMAFMWENMHLFSETSQANIRAYIPETIRFESSSPEQIAAERVQWVLKSDYGCEGDEVIVGAATSQAEWEGVLHLAVPERWVVQRYFESVRDSDGSAINHGVYLFGGKAAGLYARREHAHASYAKSAGVLVIR